MPMTEATDVPEQFNVGNAQKRSYQESPRCCSLVLDRLWRRTRDGLSAKCRNVDFGRTSNAQFFYPCLKSCALQPESSGGTVGPRMIQFVSCEKGK